MDLKQMSNAEIKTLQSNLENKFNQVKNQITECYKQLDELDVQYIECIEELNKRKIK